MHFLMAVTSRELEDAFETCLHRAGIDTALSVRGEGTVLPGILDLLGLKPTAKTVFFALATRDTARKALKSLMEGVGLSAPGRGIAVMVPISSLDRLIRDHLAGDTPIILKEGPTMNAPYELIVAIVDKGTSDQVMDAARKGGAPGGTIIHAKEANAVHARKFFGIALADEKEMLFLVVEHEAKAEVMRSILHEAGPSSAAHTVLFSLPVNEAAGLRQEEP